MTGLSTTTTTAYLGASISTRDHRNDDAAFEERYASALASFRALVVTEGDVIADEANTKMPAAAEEADSKMPAKSTRADPIANAINAAAVPSATTTTANSGASISTRDHRNFDAAFEERHASELASFQALVVAEAASTVALSQPLLLGIGSTATAKEGGLATRPTLAISARNTTTTATNIDAREEPAIGVGVRKIILTASVSCADTTKTKDRVGSGVGASSSSISISSALSKRASFGIGVGNTTQSFVGTANVGKRKATATTSPGAFATKKTRPLDSSSSSNTVASSSNAKYRLVTKKPVYKPRATASSSHMGRRIGGGLLEKKGFKIPKR